MSLMTYGAIAGAVIFVFVIGITIALRNKGNKTGYNIPTIRGENDMDKLEEDVFKEFEGAYHDMMITLEEAEKSGEGLDLKKFVTQQATRFKNLNNSFRDAKVRMLGKKR